MKKSMNKFLFVITAFPLIFLLTGCSIKEDDAYKISSQIEKSRSEISTLQYSVEDKQYSNLALDKTIYTIDKPNKRLKITMIDLDSSGNEVAKITNIETGNEYYNIQDYSEDSSDVIYRTVCPYSIYEENEKIRSDIFSQVQDEIKKYSPVKIVGTEEVNGVQAFKLSIKGGKCLKYSESEQRNNAEIRECIEFEEGTEFIWLDKNYALPVKRTYSDFERNYLNYRINENIPDSEFLIPEFNIIERPCEDEEESSR